jgi:hypothetical protein
MEWLIHLVIWVVGVVCGLAIFRQWEKMEDDKARSAAAHRAAQERAASKLKRSQSAKNAALNRRLQQMKGGVTGAAEAGLPGPAEVGGVFLQVDPAEVDRPLHGVTSGPALATLGTETLVGAVDENLYNRRNDGLSH